MILQWMMFSVEEMRQTFLPVSMRASTTVVVMRALVSGVNENQATITMDQQRLQLLQLLVDNVLKRVIPAMTLPTILLEIVVKAPPVFLILTMEHIVNQILMVNLQQLQQQEMTSGLQPQKIIGLQQLVDNVLKRVISAMTTDILDIVVKAAFVILLILLMDGDIVTQILSFDPQRQPLLNYHLEFSIVPRIFHMS